MNNQTMLEIFYMQEDLNFIHEGFGDTVKKFIEDPNKMKNLMSKLKEIKDINSFKKVTSIVPKVNLKSCDEIARKKITDYEKNKKIADTTLDFNIPESIRKPLINLIAATSFDNKQLNKAIIKVNESKIDWKTVNMRLMLRIIIGILLVTWVSAINPGIVPLYVSILIGVNIAAYLLDMTQYRV